MSFAFLVGAAVGSGITWLLAPRQSSPPSSPPLLFIPPEPPAPPLDACAELRMAIEDLVFDIADSLEVGVGRGMNFTDTNLPSLRHIV
jgi:hypothetical protein